MTTNTASSAISAWMDGWMSAKNYIGHSQVGNSTLASTAASAADLRKLNSGSGAKALEPGRGILS